MRLGVLLANLREQFSESALMSEKGEQASETAAAQLTSAAAGTPKESDDVIRARLPQLPNAAKQILSDDPAAQLEGIVFVRKLVSIATEPPFEAVLQTGILPRVIELMSKGEDPTLRYEV